MLTRLLPDQVSRLWDVIKYAIEQSVPPTSGDAPDKMNRILSSILCGKMDVWVSYVKGDSNKFEGLAVTEFLYNEIDGTKNLLLYSMFGYNPVESRKTYIEGLITLMKFAKESRCSKVVAYTIDSGIVALAKRLGADTSYTLINFNVSEFVQKLNNLAGGK
jgi:hypothetical protein